MPPSPQVISRSAARTLFLQGQGLLDDPSRAHGSAAALELIERLGFVQLDSISIVERAHHHILWARMHAYRPALLDELQHAGRVFEHWTHDASMIPTPWFPHWRHRFKRVAWSAWLKSRMGRGYRAVLDSVIERIRREGPLSARDFEHPGRKGGPWWDWKPAKAALEYWWRTGELAIPRRVRFEKVYDLTERTLPDAHALPAPPIDEHVDWACRTALARLGTATPRELAGFWGLISPAQAAAWSTRAVASGESVRVRNTGDPPSRIAIAPHDWASLRAQAADPPRELRILSPFDPLIRDRARCLRLFGFDYRFEAFVPEAKRRFGYYVLPILAGDKLVGRLDPKLDRDASILRVRRVWWEPGIKVTRLRTRALDTALNEYAAMAGATRVEVTDWGA